MQKFFKLKFVLLLLASSFVLARGLVCVKNVNSSYAMQSRVDFEKEQRNINDLKDKAFYAAFGQHISDSEYTCEDVTVVGDLKKNESVYFFLKGHPRYFNRIDRSSAYLNENESLFEINVVADGMKRLDQEELEAGGKNQIITIKDSKYQIPLGELNLITRLIYEYVNKKSFAASGLKYADFKYKADEGKLFIYLDGSYYNVNMFLQKIYA